MDEAEEGKTELGCLASTSKSTRDVGDTWL